MDEPDRDRIEEMELLAATAPCGHEPRVFEHAEMLHHADARHRQSGLERAQRLAVLAEQLVEQTPSSRVGERFEHLVHALNNR